MMIVSSNGGAMPLNTSSSARGMRDHMSSVRNEILADLDPSSRFAENLKKLLLRRSDIDFPELSLRNSEMRGFVNICMRSAMNGNGAVAAAFIIAMLVEDLNDGVCLPALTLAENIAHLSWQDGMDRILAYAPWYVSDCLKETPFHTGRHGLALTHFCLSMWLVREGCAWFIEEKGFTRIYNRSQALMYLISGNKSHNNAGIKWFLRQPKRMKPRLWWFNRHPHLAFFCGAQTACSCVDLMASALSE